MKACAKFILIGEHFVVDGNPALALPIPDLFCSVELTPLPPGEKTWVEFERSSALDLMRQAVELAADLLRMDLKARPLGVKSTVNFPILRGLGSSAAFSVALSRALNEIHSSLKEESKDESRIPEVVHALETLFHGRPSGVDAATILAGHPIRFQKGVVTPFQNLIADFVVVDTGERQGTAALIGKVQEFKSAHATRWERLGAEVSQLGEQAFRAFQGCPHAFSDLSVAVNRNSEILKELGLVPPRAQEILEFSLHVGATAGKISGAGSGGALVLMTSPGSGQRLKMTLQTRGIPVLAVVTP